MIAAKVDRRTALARLIVALLAVCLLAAGASSTASAKRKPVRKAVFSLFKQDPDDCKNKNKCPQPPPPAPPAPPAPPPPPPAPPAPPPPPPPPAPPAPPPPAPPAPAPDPLPPPPAPAPPPPAPAPEPPASSAPPPPPAPEPAPEPAAAPADEVNDLADEELPHYLPVFAAGSEPGAPDESFETPASAPPARPPAAPTAAPTPNVAYQNTPTYAPAPEAAPATPDFGESTDGLAATNAALQLVRGLEGKALRVSARGKRDSFAFVAAKRLTQKAGAPFKARALVRTPSAGMYVCLRVEELGGGIPRTTERCAAAKSGWRRVALKGIAAGKGHKLVFSIHVMAAAGGTSFDVDGFRLG